MSYRPSNWTGLEVRFLTVIQYVHCVAFARSTCTRHDSWGPPGQMVNGITVQTMCHALGQLWLNQRPLAFAPMVPNHCTPGGFGKHCA
jgi:hypothetical protein